ncbi:MAG TPA: hypothetical protein VM370_08510 [Candidatus Thermoplasmatota archaeon]|nr:hypothetical protein [Candidatus Thermoplasmatota archaeon]
MRGWVIGIGAFLLLVGIAMTVGGATMDAIGEECQRQRCDDGELFVVGAVGGGLFTGGMLLSLAGIGLIIAGIVAAEKPRLPPAHSVPIAVPARPCPACGASGLADARYCAACGAAVAPVLTRTRP